MRQFLFVVFFSLVSYNISVAQTATISGTIKDGKTGELLENATVLQPPTNGTSTNEKGHYELKVNAGDITLVISYIGMTADTEHFSIKDGESKTFDIAMGGNAVELGTVVIGESKTAIRVERVTQTVDVIKPRLLESNNITNLQQAVTKLPGVVVLDGQMSVRGGSGYAYGTGSRVMLVIDEMPLMSADRGEIKWSFIPVENIAQMELTKGASTVQYGSSALNGVLNVTTAYAVDTPNTKLTFFYEGIGKPPVASYQWWKRGGNFFQNPNTLGMSFLHKQKFGDFDFVFSGMLNGGQSWLQKEYDYFTRFNTKLRWQPHKLKRLTLEISANLMYRKDGFQFYWINGLNPYIPASGVNIDERYFYAYIDPKFRYMDKKGNQHKIYTRVFRQKNMDGLTNFWIYRVGYEFRHDFGKIVHVIAGVSNDHATVSDGTLGNHKTDFGGGYVTGELEYKWFRMNLGIREEYNRLDSALTPTTPVVCAGMNWEIRKNNFIRASFGQSFRVPSIAERFVTYQLGSISIVPNYEIKPEEGFTTELGYKRTFDIGKGFRGSFDAVAFWTEFRDMVEFTFHTRYDAPTQSVIPYFQSENISRARIFGWEFAFNGEGKIGPVDMTMQLGYTYFYGVNLNDTSYGANVRNANIGDFISDAFKRYSLPTAKDDYVWDSLTSGMLKYRNPHTFKADFEFIVYNKYHLGTSIQYYSYMTQVDAVFAAFISDIDKVRQDRRNKGDCIWDLRAGYEFNRNISLNFLVKNVLNADYAIRVARPNAPRSFTVQMIVNFGGGRTRAPKSAVSLSGY